MTSRVNHLYGQFSLVLVFLLFIFTTPYLRVYGTDENAVRILISSSAKISAVLFSLAFSISSIHSLVSNSATDVLLRNRAYLGLAFGIIHSFHLFTLVWLQEMIHPVFTLAKTSSLLGGGLAYFFMFLMMITTFDSIKSKIKTIHWKWLHLIGGYWIWAIFARTYYKKVAFEGEEYTLFGLLILVLVLRLAHLVLKKRKA